MREQTRTRPDREVDGGEAAGEEHGSLAADGGPTALEPQPHAPLTGRRIEIRGTVQGVGVRPWVYRLATAAGISGHVRNDSRGVTIEAFGTEKALDEFVDRLRGVAPPAARIREVRCEVLQSQAPHGFRIIPSRRADDRVVSIPPDLATCPACVVETLDPKNRRYRYPFTNCTNCGPRFTIASDVPYDRPATTMAMFVMCPDCQREYDDVDDRRFHAQPNACPACGPTLELRTAAGDLVQGADPIRGAADALDAGQVVAVKGIGGFHLACDATSSVAVQRLRERKRREAKPFAVMVADLEAAQRIGRLDALERQLLAGAERPVVLVARRPDAGLAAEVAPDNPLVGIILPYSPLHHLLLSETCRPLVMTSGNLSDEPIACDNDDARTRLAGIADLFLTHDREIETRADDSVARVIAGAPTVLRRSRGYVPRSVAVARPFLEPVLACGAHLKNTFCFGVGRDAIFGPHIGDLENVEAFRSYEESIARMQRFLHVSPRVVAHDLHPDYLSTRYARTRPDCVTVAVQHHHAHVASAMAEHGLSGPVLGVAYDGTGFGPDETAWGGELLFATYADYERLATFRAIGLAGGDAAIHQVWRTALAVLDDAFPDGPPLELLPLFRDVPDEALRVVRTMLARRLNVPLAHGVGRYFDAVGALVLGRSVTRYEGEVAMQWNLVADPTEERPYPHELKLDSTPWQVDLRPLVRAVVQDMARGIPAATISGRFHATVAAATIDLVRAAAERVGCHPVVLTGGCFQNAILTEKVIAGLTPDFSVFIHGEVPPGDGGLSIGQAVVANARLACHD